MSNQRKDRVIRGGFVAVAIVSGVGCVIGLIGVALGSPAVLRAASAILGVAAGTSASCVIAVKIPRLSRTGRRRHRSDM